LATGQGGRWRQYISDCSDPTQVRPPYAGRGFPQVRRRIFTAMPQVCEQGDHADHSVHPPCWVQFVTWVLGKIFKLSVFISLSYNNYD